VKYVTRRIVGRVTPSAEKSYLQGDTCAIEGCVEAKPADLDAPVCFRHATQIAGALLRRADAVMEEASAAAAARVVPRARALSLVYYVRLGPYIKIGFTNDIKGRMTSFRTTTPDLRLLAVEPGPDGRESARHRQFAELRIPRTELFRAEFSLIQHIDAIQDRWPWINVSSVLDEWSHPASLQKPPTP
jgi:hypothetical protein